MYSIYKNNQSKSKHVSSIQKKEGIRINLNCSTLKNKEIRIKDNLKFQIINKQE